MNNAPTISLINQSTVVSDAQAHALAQALQVQVTRDFAPAWSLPGATIAFVPKSGTPAPGTWWLVLLDDADQAGALGYHDVTAQDLPLGKVFCKTTLKDDGKISVTASHELLEMLGDPHVNLAAYAQLKSGATAVFAYEACDACEDDIFAYIINTIYVSDFVTPAWFDAAAPAGTRFDFGGHIAHPLQLLAGGYIGVLVASEHWTQHTADGVAHYSADGRYRGNRWHRRVAGRAGRVCSTAHAEHVV